MAAQKAVADLGTTESRIDDMRSHPQNRTIADIDWLLCGQAGCNKRPGKGSHFVYKHPTISKAGGFASVVIPFNRPIKEWYVRKALEYHDALKEEME